MQFVLLWETDKPRNLHGQKKLLSTGIIPKDGTIACMYALNDKQDSLSMDKSEAMYRNA